VNKYIAPKNTNQYKNIYCANCGEKGHVVKDCNKPITSFGIIALKVIYNKEQELSDKNVYLSDLVKDTKYTKDTKDEGDIYPKIKYLLIQRKDTMGYIDFIRGKYSNTDEIEKYIKINTCLNEMTFVEKGYLLNLTFDQIWDQLWTNKFSVCYKKEYENAKKKYNNLDISNLVKNSKTIYTYNEFSFPKGRRNMKETNITCAEREFFEETGYDKTTYEFIKNYPIIQEEFLGTNNIKYKHTYYLVKMKDNVHPPKIDLNNHSQIGEVKNLGWFTFNESISLLRPYDIEKKKVLVKVNIDVVKMNFKFICSNFYSNYCKW
jgi:8-oxo-dGTP pyrophosphatase MutT (NUDIX family)